MGFGTVNLASASDEYHSFYVTDNEEKAKAVHEYLKKTFHAGSKTRLKQTQSGK